MARTVMLMMRVIDCSIRDEVAQGTIGVAKTPIAVPSEQDSYEADQPDRGVHSYQKAVG